MDVRLVKRSSYYYAEDKCRWTTTAAAVKGWRLSLMMVWQGCQRVVGSSIVFYTGTRRRLFDAAHDHGCQPSELRTHTITNTHPCYCPKDWQGHMAKQASNSNTNRHDKP